MSRSHKTDIQNAQAMVEFALVLPILLLVIFGIFAFGHLFFTYSLVVAASREAARFGSAVGLTGSNLPSYRDCNEIRAAGVRVGNLAGVNADDITVQYDEGVPSDGSPATIYPHDCPIDGIGPGYIELGDRIVVTVTVNYRPIVPLINFDEFPLVAETRRTIIIGMPVGDVTPAAASCTGTIVRILPLDDHTAFEDLTVGEYFSAQLEVISDNPAQPALGTVRLYYNDPEYDSPVCTGNASAITDCSFAPNFWGSRIYDIPVVPTVANTLTPVPTAVNVLRAKYEPAPGYLATAVPCFNPALAEPIAIVLHPAPTITTIISISIIATDDGDRARVEVNVVSDTSELDLDGIPAGPVTITDELGHSCTVTLTNPYSSGFCDIELTHFGNNRITVIYNPDGDPNHNRNYLSSTAQADYYYNTPTPSPTPTIITPAVTRVVITETFTPTPTSTSTPTPTATP